MLVCLQCVLYRALHFGGTHKSILTGLVLKLVFLKTLKSFSNK